VDNFSFFLQTNKVKHVKGMRAGCGSRRRLGGEGEIEKKRGSKKDW